MKTECLVEDDDEKTWNHPAVGLEPVDPVLCGPHKTPKEGA